MRHRRILLGFLALVAVLAAATWVVLTRTGLVGSLVAGVLSRTVRGELSIADVRLELMSGKVTFDGVTLRHPDQPRAAALQAERIEVDIGTNPFDRLGAVRHVRVIGLTVELDLAGERPPDLAAFVRRRPGTGAARAEDLPSIEIRQARARLQLAPEAPPLLLDPIDLALLPAEGAEAERLVLDGRVQCADGWSARIAGGIERRTGELRALAEAKDVPLSDVLVRAFDGVLAERVRRAELSGIARRVVVSLEHPGSTRTIDTGTGFEAAFAVELENVSCAPVDVPYELRGARGRATFATRGGGTLRFELQRQDATGDLVARGVMSGLMRGDPSISLGLEGRGIVVDSALARTVRGSNKDADELWRAFEPEGGTVDASLHLGNDVPGGPLRLAMDLDLHGVRGQLAGLRTAPDQAPLRFPYPLQDLEGLIQVRPGGHIVVHGVRGRHADGGKLTIFASLGREPVSGQRTTNIEIQGRDVQFSSTLREAIAAILPKDGGDIYDEYAPSGRTDVDVRIDAGTGRETEVRVALRPQAASATFRGFPYRVDDIRGAIDIASEGVTIGLEGRRGEAQVRVDGRFHRRAAVARAASELWLRLTHVRLDEELARALETLDPGLRDVWTWLSPSGVAGAEVSLWREGARDPFVYDVRLDLEDAAIQAVDYPLPLRRLAGPVLIHRAPQGNDVELCGVRGEIAAGEAGASSVLLQGTVATRGPGELAMDLFTVARGLELDERVQRMLDRQGVVDRATWNVLMPSGRVDVVAHVEQGFAPGAEKAPATHSVRVLLRDVGSTAQFLPGAATGMRGEIRIENGLVTLHEVHGAVGGTEVQVLSGNVRHFEGATHVAVDVRADVFRVDARLANLMTGPLRTAYLDRNVEGNVRLDALQLRLRFPDDGGPMSVEFEGQFLARGLKLLLAAEVRNVNGLCTVRHARIDQHGGVIEGSLANLSFSVFDQPGHAFQASFHADPERIEFRDVQMRLHGGRIEEGEALEDVAGKQVRAPSLRYSLEAPGTLQANLRWRGVSLREFLRAASPTPPPLAGSVAGTLNLLSLRGGDVVSMEADVTVEIANGSLGEVPVFAAIFAVLEPRKRPRFDGLQMTYALRSGTAEVQNLVVSSPLMKVTGTGRVSLDGYVDLVLDFPDLFGTPGDIVILPRVLRFLSSQVVRFHVYGWLRHLKARPRLLWQSDPGRVKIEPLPSWSTAEGRR